MTSKAAKPPKAGNRAKSAKAKAPAQIPEASRCFVYITLAGETECGLKRLRTAIQIDCGQRGDDCGQQLPVDGFMGSRDGRVCQVFHTWRGFLGGLPPGLIARPRSQQEGPTRGAE
jgi:hypothetical protein